MTDLLSEPVSEISPADIDAMVASALPEGERVEFKRSLPTAKGKRDPWEIGKEPGDKAKNEILEEVTAFANAYGGVLFLGIAESSTKPAAATAIAPVPRCMDLAERFNHIFRDCVEPQLPTLEIFAVPIDRENGVIIFRVGRSHTAPHRVTKTLVCPVRRADRCEKMTMHEIQDMTLNMSKGLERLERRLSNRSTRFTREFERLPSPDNAFGCRFTAVPANDDIRFPSVFQNDTIVEGLSVRWKDVFLNGRPMQEARCGPRAWRAVLRGTRSDTRTPQVEYTQEGHLIRKKIDSNFYHEIHCDGLVEFGGLHGSNWDHQFFPPDWLFVMFGNLLLWVDNLRQLSRSISAEYVLEVELYLTSRAPLPIDDYGDTYWPPDNPNQKFPHYVISGDNNIQDVLAIFYRDARHLVGHDVGGTISIAI